MGVEWVTGPGRRIELKTVLSDVSRIIGVRPGLDTHSHADQLPHRSGGSLSGHFNPRCRTAALRTDTIYRRETHRWIVAWFLTAALGLIVLSCSWTSWSAQAGAASLLSHEHRKHFRCPGQAGRIRNVLGRLCGVARLTSRHSRSRSGGVAEATTLHHGTGKLPVSLSVRGVRLAVDRKGNKSMGLPTSRRCYCLDLQRPWPVPTLSNGFFLAVTPFIPGVVLGDINELTGGLKAHQVKGIQFFALMSARFGSLQCMKVDEQARASTTLACW